MLYIYILKVSPFLIMQSFSRLRSDIISSCSENFYKSWMNRSGDNCANRCHIQLLCMINWVERNRKRKKKIKRMTHKKTENKCKKANERKMEKRKKKRKKKQKNEKYRIHTKRKKERKITFAGKRFNEETENGRRTFFVCACLINDINLYSI